MRDLLVRMGMPFRFTSRAHPSARNLRRLRRAPDAPPGRRSDHGDRLGSSVRELAAVLRLDPTTSTSPRSFDLCVVGAGPSGFATAVYGASEGLRPWCSRRRRSGAKRYELDDPQLPRLSTGHLGYAAGPRARLQAPRFGTRFVTGWDATGLTPSLPGEPHVVHTDGGDLRARSVVIATGASYRRLGRSGDRRADGPRRVFSRQPMTAAREMVAWTSWSSAVETRPARPPCICARFARTVTIAVRRDGLGETMSRYLIDEIDWNDRVECNMLRGHRRWRGGALGMDRRSRHPRGDVVPATAKGCSCCWEQSPAAVAAAGGRAG